MIFQKTFDLKYMNSTEKTTISARSLRSFVGFQYNECYTQKDMYWLICYLTRNVWFCQQKKIAKISVRSLRSLVVIYIPQVYDNMCVTNKLTNMWFTRKLTRNEWFVRKNAKFFSHVILILFYNNESYEQ